MSTSHTTPGRPRGRSGGAPVPAAFRVRPVIAPRTRPATGCDAPASRPAPAAVTARAATALLEVPITTHNAAGPVRARVAPAGAAR
jgi:hypothetical protein